MICPLVKSRTMSDTDEQLSDCFPERTRCRFSAFRNKSGIDLYERRMRQVGFRRIALAQKIQVAKSYVKPVKYIRGFGRLYTMACQMIAIPFDDLVAADQ